MKRDWALKCATLLDINVHKFNKRFTPRNFILLKEFFFIVRDTQFKLKNLLVSNFKTFFFVF